MAFELARTLRCAALCVAACAVLVSSERLALSAPPSHRRRDDDFALKIAQILRAQVEAAEEATIASLSHLGPPSVPAMLAVLREGELASLLEFDVAEPLRAAQRHALLQALKRWPDAWRSHVAALAASEELRTERAGAVVVLGEIAEGGDFALLFALARPALEPANPAAPRNAPPETLPIPDEEAAAFQHAVELVLARDLSACSRLEQPFIAGEVQLQTLAIQAVASRGALPGLELLARLLGERPDLDQQLLTGIAKLASSLAPPFDGSILERARVYLRSSSAEVQREAALVAGRLEDDESLPLLIALLEHENRGVRQNAYWSLRKITGLGFKDAPGAWTPWLDEQTKWWRETAPDLFEELATAERARALSIVQEVARRRFPRHALAHELARGLGHDDAEVRRLTCVALAQFRSRAAVLELVDCFEDQDADVRKEALRAAQSITGFHLPAERAAWEQALR